MIWTLEAERAERALQLQGKSEIAARRIYLRTLDPLCKSIQELDLQIHVMNELMSAGIKYTTDLKNLTRMELMKIGLSQNGIDQCIVQLRKAGYKISSY